MLGFTKPVIKTLHWRHFAMTIES